MLCDDEVLSDLADHIIVSVSKVDILVCTPGRLVEHLKSTPGFTLENVKWLVIDEADKLLDQSFQQWLNTVMTALPSATVQTLETRDKIRKIILSATMTRDIGQLKSLKLHRPKLVVLEGSSSADEENPTNAHVLPSLLVESAIKVDDENVKPLYLLELIALYEMVGQVEVDLDATAPDTDSNADSSSSSDDDSSKDESSSDETILPNVETETFISQGPRGVLIFTKSNETAVRLGRLIALLKPEYSDIIGTLTSTTRSSTRKAFLNSFSQGKLSILVASDLVSRGLDLPNLAHVINYDIPTSLTSYVHRVGRTARAGKKGQAWTLLTNAEARWFWTEIVRSDAIQRPGDSKVGRVNIDATKFDEARRKGYEVALEVLGREASTSKSTRSSHR